MELHVHNNASIKYSKLVNLVNLISKMSVDKFTKTRNWKLECWVSDKNDEDETIDCGVALIRPKKSIVYSKKNAGSFKKVLHSCIKELEETVREEREHWSGDRVVYS